MANSKKANRKMIEMGNAKMLAAWKQGIALSSADGKRPNRVAIREASGGSISEAERLRKYRAMSERIKEAELTQITNLCIDFDRAWGPTLLCELSKIHTKKDRQKIAKNAIEQGLGLVELKRMVRLERGSPKQGVRQAKGSPKQDVNRAKGSSKQDVKQAKGSSSSTDKEKTRVGRKRALDWTQPTNVLDEVHQVCGDFLTFAIDIHRVAAAGPKKSAVVKLLLKIMPQVEAAEEAISQLQTDCDVKLKRRHKISR